MTENEKKLYSRLETLKEDVYSLQEEVQKESFSASQKEWISLYIARIYSDMELIQERISLNLF